MRLRAGRRARFTTTLPRGRDRPRDDPRPGRRGAPELLIVDSVQTVSSLSDGLAGHRARCARSRRRSSASRRTGLPVHLVGHVTKDGTIAGPRLLEHLVDAVVPVRGRPADPLRLVGALKNRFGPTDEVGCFEMTGDGIAEVPDPSGSSSVTRERRERHVRPSRSRTPEGAARRGAGARGEHQGAAAAAWSNGVDPSRVAMSSRCSSVGPASGSSASTTCTCPRWAGCGSSNRRRPRSPSRSRGLC